MTRKPATNASPKPKPKAKPRKKPKTLELAPRHAVFAAAYAKHGNATQAACEAGYSQKTAKVQGSRLLTYADVQSEITRLVKGAMTKAEATVERIVDEFALMAFSDLADFVEWGPNGVTLKSSAALNEAQRRAIVEVKQGQFGVSIKLASKQAALDSLGKYRGMFIDRHEVKITNLAELLKTRRERARKAHGGGR